MTTRLILLCAGATASARRGGFPDPAEPLDAGGAAKARALRVPDAATASWWTSPARAAQETAAALGVDPAVEPALRDIDHGIWTGTALAAIDPDAVSAWLAAPQAGTPGGESLAAVVARIGPWIDRIASGGQRVGAITHAAVIRAALVATIGVPAAAALAVDIAPLSATVLSFHGRWRLQELRRAVSDAADTYP